MWGKETRFTLATRNDGRSVAPTLWVLRILRGCRRGRPVVGPDAGLEAAMVSDVCAHLVVGQAADLLLVRRERAIDAMAAAVTVLESRGERTAATAPGGC